MFVYIFNFTLYLERSEGMSRNGIKQWLFHTKNCIYFQWF